ncbi:helicase associated domain-containing protein [Streptomyces sp. NPDC021056]|uniref:helicase associated domain-containing protein n=1 Tax=Streptomyces sp. NPDC021056 TaxID=3155012 RepID=UPI0033F97ACE
MDPESESVSVVPVRRSQGDRWAANLAAVRQFHASEGHVRVPRKAVETVDGVPFKIGASLDNARRRIGKLSMERRAELAALGLQWAARWARRDAGCRPAPLVSLAGTRQNSADVMWRAVRRAAAAAVRAGGRVPRPGGPPPKATEALPPGNRGRGPARPQRCPEGQAGLSAASAGEEGKPGAPGCAAGSLCCGIDPL